MRQPSMIVSACVMIVLLFLTSAATWAADKDRKPPTDAEVEAVKGKDLIAVIETDRGAITLELFADDAPYTVANFKKLADDGFYDGIAFHRVIPDFMVQTGDPTGTGRGGPGYKFKDEASALRLKHVQPGTLSMANAGPNTNGSQFFITHKATPWLNGKHAVFGKVTEGMDVVNKIQRDEKMKSVIVRESAEEPPAEAQADPVQPEALKPDVTAGKLIWAMGSNSVRSNHLLLTSSSTIYQADPDKNAESIRRTMILIQKDMAYCRDLLERFAQDNQIENNEMVMRLVNGYKVLIQQAESIREYVDDPSEDRLQRLLEHTDTANKLVIRDFINPSVR